MSKVFGGNFAVSTTAPVSITTGLGLTPDESVGASSNFTVQADSTNQGNIYVGGVDMTTVGDACLVLDAGQSLGEILNVRYLNLDNLYLLAESTGDKVYVLAIQ